MNVIEGGGNTFILPHECRAFITVVYLPGENLEEVKAEVEGHVRTAANTDPWLARHPPQVEWNPQRFPIEFLPIDCPADEPGLFRPREMFGDNQWAASCDLRPRRDHGRRVAQEKAGIPAVLGAGDRHVIHQPDEYVEIDDVVIFAKTIALFLLRWCSVGRSSALAERTEAVA